MYMVQESDGMVDVRMVTSGEHPCHVTITVAIVISVVVYYILQKVVQVQVCTTTTCHCIYLTFSCINS